MGEKRRIRRKRFRRSRHQVPWWNQFTVGFKTIHWIWDVIVGATVLITVLILGVWRALLNFISPAEASWHNINTISSPQGKPFSSTSDYFVPHLIIAMLLLLGSQETQVQFLGWDDPLEKEWSLTPVFLPREFHGQKNLVGYRTWRCKEPDATERLSLTHTPFTLRPASFFLSGPWISIFFPHWKKGRGRGFYSPVWGPEKNCGCTGKIRLKIAHGRHIPDRNCST